jgi:UTP--glucose-1-phosphate uridylyltransferase
MLNLKGMKAVITAGGMGTRLLPFSKEIPKEMSPILTKNSGDTIFVKPVIQAIFEQLYDCGIRDFLAVVGRGKRAIEDHFTPDQAFIAFLKEKGKNADALVHFYDKIVSSNLVFIIQAEPRGFGDAVLRTRDYVSSEFIVHAGDTYLISPHNEYLERLFRAHKEFNAEATILLQDVKDPWNYGIVTGKDFSGGVMAIEKAIEKPSDYISNTAIMPVYIFKESIFGALENLSAGKGGEIQLTDAIQNLISENNKVMGVKLSVKDFRLDIGSPQTLMDALEISSQHLGGNGNNNH